MKAMDDTSATDWCSCGHCSSVHGSENDNCCCQSESISNVKDKEGKTCITNTKVYLDVVENRDILKLLRFTYSKGSSTYMEKQIGNNGYRHLCYKFFVFLINCHSSVHMTRYILPSCVVLLYISGSTTQMKAKFIRVSSQDRPQS